MISGKQKKGMKLVFGGFFFLSQLGFLILFLFLFLFST